jgi:hypothetical protein
MGVAKRLNLNATPVSEEVGNKNFAKNYQCIV